MAAFTWFASAAANVTITTTPADEMLDGLNTMFAANSSAGAASWEVVDYQSSSPKSLLLRRKSGAPGRIIIFGQNGGTPNAAATAGTPSASTLYLGYAPASSSSTPDASWLSGAPLSGTYLAAHALLGTLTSYTARLRYYEFADGVVVAIVNAAPGSHISGAGKLTETTDGTAMETLLSSGSTALNTFWSSTNFINPTPGTNAGTGATNPFLRVIHPTVGNLVCARLAQITAGAQQRLDNASASRISFSPVWLVGPTDVSNPTLVGKLRQMCAGPYCLRETTKFDAGSPTTELAYGHSQNAATPGEALWFTNIEV